jgi:phosphoglycerate kinase
MKTLTDFDFSKKKVLVRCDFNVPISKDGKIQEEFRIKAALPTIEYLKKQKAKIILLSHLEIKEKPESLKPVAEQLPKILNTKVKFIPTLNSTEIEKEVKAMKEGEIVLVENLRFDPREKKCEMSFAKELARLGDFYVNEAFSCSHRKHTSIYLLPQLLPSAAGFRLVKEIEVLSKLLENPERPLVAIIGGIKIETKIKTILNLLEKADHLLLGSKIGENILAQKMILVGRDFVYEPLVDQIQLTNPKLHLPVDGRISLKEENDVYLRTGGIGTLRKEEAIYDIGPETIHIFVEIIKNAKTIFWSGPLGMFENPRFKEGTKRIAEAIVRNHSAFKVVGGGDTIFAINSFGLLDHFDFVSTGGGAMLEFLAGEKLPGIEILEHGNQKS